MGVLRQCWRASVCIHPVKRFFCIYYGHVGIYVIVSLSPLHFGPPQSADKRSLGCEGHSFLFLQRRSRFSFPVSQLAKGRHDTFTSILFSCGWPVTQLYSLSVGHTPDICNSLCSVWNLSFYYLLQLKKIKKINKERKYCFYTFSL